MQSSFAQLRCAGDRWERASATGAPSAAALQVAAPEIVEWTLWQLAAIEARDAKQAVHAGERTMALRYGRA